MSHTENVTPTDSSLFVHNNSHCAGSFSAAAILRERGEGEIVLKGTGGGGGGGASSSSVVSAAVEESSSTRLFPPVKRAGEKSYNSMREVRFIDMDRDSKPTPSPWQE